MSRKVVNSELYKKLKFDHATKWYMHNAESVIENETHTVIWDFEQQTDHAEVQTKWQIRKTKGYVRGSYNMFADFFRIGTFIDSTRMKL